MVNSIEIYFENGKIGFVCPSSTTGKISITREEYDRLCYWVRKEDTANIEVTTKNDGSFVIFRHKIIYVNIA